MPGRDVFAKLPEIPDQRYREDPRETKQEGPLGLLERRLDFQEDGGGSSSQGHEVTLAHGSPVCRRPPSATLVEGEGEQPGCGEKQVYGQRQSSPAYRWAGRAKEGWGSFKETQQIKQEGSRYLAGALGLSLTLERQGKAAPFPAASPGAEGRSLTSAPSPQLQPCAPPRRSPAGQMPLYRKLLKSVKTASGRQELCGTFRNIWS